MPHASRPGDLLADRYHLLDLLDESGDGRFWRAHDLMLERFVAVHVIRDDDARAPLLTDAARRSATVHDPHILRVLDTDVVDGLCYVVNEWGTGASLDIIVANNGALGPRRGAWLVAQVATALATAHDVGVAHGRLTPENVLVDRSGGVRIIGMCVDAALHGLEPDPAHDPERDVVDLAGVLYCALTTTWAGASTSEVAPAPRHHGSLLRPRRVRAGVPRALDAICDQVLGQGRRPTMATLAEELLDFVGDPTGLAESLLASTPEVAEEEFVVLPPLPDLTLREAARIEAPPPPPTPSPLPPSSTPAAAGEDLPTEAGLPIFGEGDDVSWLAKDPEPAPPPPPFEAPPERPLFAPDPAPGEPVRRRREGAAADPDSGYWPWGDSHAGPGVEVVDPPAPRAAPGAHRRDTGSPDPLVDSSIRQVRRLSQTDTDAHAVGAEVPGRRFLRLAAVLTVLLLVAVAILIGVNLGRGKTPLGREPSSAPSTSAAPSPTTPTPRALTGLTATILDPEGDGQENAQDVANAVDDDPATAWPTQTYRQQLGPGGLKDGVGLVVDLGASVTLSRADVSFIGSPTSVQLFVTNQRPDSVQGLEPAATGTAQGTDPEVRTGLDATGHFLVVWLTGLPQTSDGFRGEVASVRIDGVPAADVAN